MDFASFGQNAPGDFRQCFGALDGRRGAAGNDGFGQTSRLSDLPVFAKDILQTFERVVVDHLVGAQASFGVHAHIESVTFEGKAPSLFVKLKGRYAEVRQDPDDGLLGKQSGKNFGKGAPHKANAIPEGFKTTSRKLQSLRVPIDSHQSKIGMGPEQGSAMTGVAQGTIDQNSFSRIMKAREDLRKKNRNMGGVLLWLCRMHVTRFAWISSEYLSGA